MLRLLAAITLVAIVPACAGTGSAGRADAGTTTPAAVASISATRTGGIGGTTRSLEVGPSDPRLAGAAASISLPLPGSADLRQAGCADCYDTEITVILTDGSSATWRFDQQPPDGVAGLARWVEEQFSP
jgi:hypothetical protein